jgi:hypothetical protein
MTADALAASHREAVSLWLNAAWPRGDAIDLSILIPFHEVVPLNLICNLLAAAKKLQGIEIVLGDDGSSDVEGSRAYCDVAEGTGIPCALLTLDHKVGRSAMRNVLFTQARGAFLLHLDAHFELESLSYLSDWLVIARANMTDVAYGGYITREVVPQHDEFVARWNRCPSLKKRRSDPPWHGFTGNLLVRRSVMERIAFDEDFVGWGWEDVDWSLRASAIASFAQVDIPLVKHPRSDVLAIVEKLEQSIQNFKRLAVRHPRIRTSYSVYWGSRLAAILPCVPALKRWCLVIIVDRRWPPSVRFLAAKLYQMCAYGVGLRSTGNRQEEHVQADSALESSGSRVSLH